MLNYKTDLEETKNIEELGHLMRESLETSQGLNELAAAIAKPIDLEIKRREISSMLLTRHLLPKGEHAIYQLRPKIKAYWIAKGGHARMSEIDPDGEIEIPTVRIHANPMVDISVIRNANMGSLMDVQMAAAESIRKEIDNRTIQVLSSAVEEKNIITVSGGKLTSDSLNNAISIIEDQDTSIKFIIMRGGRFNDIRSWEGLDQNTKSELREKGLIKNYGTASILLTSAMAKDEVLLLPNIEVGKMPIRSPLKTEAVHDQTGFKTGWLIWTEIGHGVVRSDLLTKVKITS